LRRENAGNPPPAGTANLDFRPPTIFRFVAFLVGTLDLHSRLHEFKNGDDKEWFNYFLVGKLDSSRSIFILFEMANHGCLMVDVILMKILVMNFVLLV
jgi:hypothetical protein